jgi:hypothetical protein
VVHRTGWEHYLPRLALVAEGTNPGPDPWHDFDAVLEQLRAAGVPSQS